MRATSGMDNPPSSTAATTRTRNSVGYGAIRLLCPRSQAFASRYKEKKLPQKLKKTDTSHGWIGTETVKSRLGNFKFKNSYPAGEAAQQLRDALTFNRAVEAYLVQMPAVSWYHVWKGVADAGSRVPNQMVIWETLMDAQSLLLTGNTETVYGLCSFDLKRDG